MWSQVALYAILTASGWGAIAGDRAVASGRLSPLAPQLVFAATLEMVPAVFVQVRRGLGREFRQRFLVRIANGVMVDFELAANGVVTRNDQPARLVVAPSDGQ